MRFKNRLDRFFLGRIDERACVDDQNVGILCACGDFHAVLQNASEHDLSIDKILGAAEADHANLCAHVLRNAGEHATRS